MWQLALLIALEIRTPWSTNFARFVPTGIFMESLFSLAFRLPCTLVKRKVLCTVIEYVAGWHCLNPSDGTVQCVKLPKHFGKTETA